MNLALRPVTFSAASAPWVHERIDLHAGGLYAGYNAAMVTTVVSSSVAVSIWTPLAAGIAHYVLPFGGTERSLHFGNQALPALFERLIALGAEPNAMVARITGGAAQLPGFASLGRRNVTVALEFLSRHDISVISRETGGLLARHLTFTTTDGSTVSRALSRDHKSAHDKS